MSSTDRRPLPLLIGAITATAEALTLVVLAVLVLADLGGGWAAGGVPTALLLLAVAAGLGFCVWNLVRLESWARAPVVLAQLILLGLAWDFRHGDLWLPVLLVAIAVVVLVGIFHPRSLHAMEND